MPGHATAFTKVFPELAAGQRTVNPADERLYVVLETIIKELADLCHLLAENNAVFAIIPPVTALLESQTLERECVAWPELGMEALYRIKVKNYQAIIAAAKGESIY